MSKLASVSLDWHPYKMNGYLHDLQPLSYLDMFISCWYEQYWRGFSLL